MDNQKIKIYALIGVGVFIIIALIVYALISTGGTNSTESDDYPETVKNALNYPVRQNNGWNTLVETDNYQISHSKSPSGDAFFITLINGPVVQVSKEAEQQFLKTLQIEQAYACTLPVIINIPEKVDANTSGYDFGMSFCPGRIHVSDKASR